MLPSISMEAGCIEFTGKKRKDGYGVKYVRFENGKRITMLAHRWMWECENGPIPDGMVVMHTCDNPPCVNIHHLRLGTQADNARDMAEKGRGSNQNKGIEVCRRGHSDFVMKSDGKRYCRPCQYERDRLYRKGERVASHHPR